MNIQNIFQAAKDDILSDGEHRATIWAELAVAGITLFDFADFPYRTTREKQRALFVVARKFGLEHRDDELRQICFVTEAWTSEEIRTYRFPEEDPNRKEQLVAIVLDVPAPKTHALSMYTAELLRDGSGELVDLLPHGKYDGKVNSPLLMAFLAGFESAKLSDEQYGSILAQARRKHP